MSFAQKCLILFVFLLPAFPLIAQRQISVDDFTTRNTFKARSVTGINWTDDGKFYTTLESNKIVKYDVSNGQAVDTIFDGNALLPDVKIEEYSFSSDGLKILLAADRVDIYRRSWLADHYIYDVSSKKVGNLSEEGKQSYATFSPDGTKVAFVRSNDLFYTDLGGMREQRVTQDGKFNHIINGTTDWVYEEELSFVIGFFWSPDSRKLAYYRFDESQVREYNLQVWGDKLYPADYRFKYPKAGEANSDVTIHIHHLDTRRTVQAQIPDEAEYIPRVQWTADPDLLAVRTLNRLQNELTLLHISALTGERKEVVVEKSETYIDLRFVEDLVYLKNGKHLISASEKSGFKHLYLYTIDGKLVRQITTGDYEVSSFIGVDEKRNAIFYTSTEASPLERQFYRIGLDGKKKTRLTAGKGQHHINMSPDFTFYIDYHKSSDNPPVVTLFQTKGNREIRILENNAELTATLKEFGVAPKEFFTYKSVDGTPLNGYFLKPDDFAGGKKYPVILYQYSGPGSQNAGDTWAGSHFFFHQLLAQKGFIVAVVDTRGTGGRGEKFKKLTYKQLGKFELQDILAAAE